MPIPDIQPGDATQSAVRVYQNAGAPVAAVNDVQTITVGATGGTYKIFIPIFDLFTAAIPFGANAAAVQAAVDAISPAPSTIVVGGTTAPTTFTAALSLAGMLLAPFTADNTAATGGTVTFVHSTPGVFATFATIAQKGALLVDVTNTQLYINTGSKQVPVWAQIAHA